VKVQQAIPANVGYKGFPDRLHLGQQRHLPRHPQPGKVLKDGDIVNIDVTVIKDGWHGDTSRMYFVGKPVGDGAAPGRSHPRGHVPRHPRGASRARPWATSATRSSSMPKASASRVVREYCGHGIGKVYHEDPQVLHYGQPAPAWC
jgi:methionyl aminopeptidase